MKNPILLSLAAIALAAAALASSLLDRAPSALQESRPPVGSARESSDSLAGRVEELTKENRVLRDRIEALERRPLDAPREPVPLAFVAQEEFDAFRDEVRELLYGGPAIASEIGAGSESFKEQVASTLSEIRKEEAVGKAREWQEGRVERLDETMPKIESWLELSPYQSDQMRSALIAQFDREADLTRRWEAGEDPAVLGEVKRSDREAHLAELSGFLTAEQLESYSAGGGGAGK